MKHRFNFIRMRKSILHILIWIIALLLFACSKPDSLSLHGTWKFQIDSENIGIQNQWYMKNLDDEIYKISRV